MSCARSFLGIVVLGLAMVVAPACARDDKASGQAGVAITSPAITYPATGVVRKINRIRSTVTLDQDPVERLGWPARTVTLPVREAKLLERLTVGTRVEYEFRKEHEGYVLTVVK